MMQASTLIFLFMVCGPCFMKQFIIKTARKESGTSEAGSNYNNNDDANYSDNVDYADYTGRYKDIV